MRAVTFLCEYFTIMDVVLKIVLIFAFDILGIDISLVKCLYFLKKENIVYFVICTPLHPLPSVPTYGANSIFVAW